MSKKIYTHLNPDLDATSSVWAVRRLVPGFQDAEVIFVPANWQGEGWLEGDFAVDISVGGRGLKGFIGEDGKRHSSFAALVQIHATANQQKALRPLVQFIDAQDTHGNALRHFVPDIDPEAFDVFQFTGTNAVLRAFQAMNPKNDAIVLAKMSEIYDGLYANGFSRLLAEKEADQAEWIGNSVAIKNQMRHSATTHILFERGAKVVLFLDRYSMGMHRSSEINFRLDHPDIRRVIEEAGEQIGDGPGFWFAHPEGWLICRGSRKAPATNNSRVDPRLLAQTVANLITTIQVPS